MDAIERFRLRAGLRLGIMGGSFDPIHVGHLLTAQEAFEQFELHEVLFVPTGLGPHKGVQIAPPEVRYLMVAAAIAEHAHFWISRYEIDSPGIDYTVDTLSFLKQVLPADTEFFFITGADAVLGILSWKDPEKVLGLCTVIVANRPGYDLGGLSSLLAGLGRSDKVKLMEIPALAVSSSMIRERLAAGRGVRFLVPENVRQLIDKFGVYRISV